MKKQVKEYEVKLFNQLAKEGEYELAPKQLYEFIVKFMKSSKLHPKGKILEAGCGNGSFGKSLFKKSHGLKITGVDISPGMVKRANDGTKSYKAIVGDLENSKLFKNGSFDGVLCSLVLHHFPSLETVINNFRHWTKKNGFIVAVEPNSLNLTAILSRVIRKLVEQVFGKDYLVKTKMATPNEINHSFGEYQNLLLKNKFKVIKSKYFYEEPDLPISPSLGSLRTLVSRFLNKAFPNSKMSMTNIIFIARKFDA